MKYQFVLAIAIATFAGGAFAQAAAPVPNANCEQVLGAAKAAKQEEMDKIEKERRNAAKRAQESQSCLARAGDSIIRAAIPPSLGSILGVLTDPEGYIRNSTSNAACNIITSEANEIGRGASDVNGAIRKAGSDAQGVFTGGVDGALGGNSRGGYYSGAPKQEDQGFFQSMSCRLFGKC